MGMCSAYGKGKCVLELFEVSSSCDTSSISTHAQLNGKGKRLLRKWTRRKNGKERKNCGKSYVVWILAAFGSTRLFSPLLSLSKDSAWKKARKRTWNTKGKDWKKQPSLFLYFKLFSRKEVTGKWVPRSTFKKRKEDRTNKRSLLKAGQTERKCWHWVFCYSPSISILVSRPCKYYKGTILCMGKTKSLPMIRYTLQTPDVCWVASWNSPHIRFEVNKPPKNRCPFVIFWRKLEAEKNNIFAPPNVGQPTFFFLLFFSA